MRIFRKHLAGKTLVAVNSQHAEKVFGTVGIRTSEFEMKLRGEKVADAGQEEKKNFFFW